MILLQSGGKTHKLAFPEDACEINERVLNHLAKHFRVVAEVKEAGGNGGAKSTQTEMAAD